MRVREVRKMPRNRMGVPGRVPVGWKYQLMSIHPHEVLKNGPLGNVFCVPKERKQPAAINTTGWNCSPLIIKLEREQFIHLPSRYFPLTMSTVGWLCTYCVDLWLLFYTPLHPDTRLGVPPSWRPVGVEYRKARRSLQLLFFRARGGGLNFVTRSCRLLPWTIGHDCRPDRFFQRLTKAAHDNCDKELAPVLTIFSNIAPLLLFNVCQCRCVI